MIGTPAQEVLSILRFAESEVLHLLVIVTHGSVAMGCNMQVDSELLQVCAHDLVRVNNKDDLVEFPWGIGHR